jgi:hypothetical protein
MTQRRKTRCPECDYDLDPITNYFDRISDGIGHRGSSFSDIDRLDGALLPPPLKDAPLVVTHDGGTPHCHRFLIQEYKEEGEAMGEGQRRTLEALATQEHFTVWQVVRRRDGRVGWKDLAAERAKDAETITATEYRARVERWWNIPIPPPEGRPLTRDEEYAFWESLTR